MSGDVPTVVSARLQRRHRSTVESVRDCAAAAAREGTDSDGRSDTSRVRHGIEHELREAGVWTSLPSVLVDCVDAMGGSLRATPVAAPPYVAPTATGVVLRATLAGGRLVVAIDALAIDRDGDGVRLTPRDVDVPLAELLRVEWRTQSQ